MFPTKNHQADVIPTIRVIDLFCGAGGLAYGLRSAGCEIAAGIDLDPACRHPFESNCGGEFLQKSVAELSSAELSDLYGDAEVRVLAGCAPCQPFSTYSQSRRTPDGRWELLRSFHELAVKIKPEIVTMENVPGLASKLIWNDFVVGLEGAGYSVSWSEVRCSDYGVPQTRKRLVLIASRIGEIEIPKPISSGPPTVREAISQLRPLAAGETDQLDRLHTASRLSSTNLRRIQASRPGGTWRDWPPGLRAICHGKQSGETYPAVYGRMTWDEPAPTMTTQCFGYGNGRFGHPEQDRAISLREAALLQSFPASYSFVPDGTAPSFSKVGMLIGNAVPPALGQAIGSKIVGHVRTRHEHTLHG